MNEQRKRGKGLAAEMEELRHEVVALRTAVAERDRAAQELRRQFEERAMELNCLLGISRVAERDEMPLDELLMGIVTLLPPAWQYPEITCARIILEGREFRTANFEESPWRQIRDITVGGIRRGSLEVVYLRDRPERDEGPFLKEEASLIDAVAERVGRIVERRRAEEALRRTHQELEMKVRLRTADLEQANEHLRIEIGEHRRTEAAFRKVHRALKVLSQCNNALVHAGEESELLHEICRIIAEAGEYRLAWVGFAEESEEKAVRPVAQAGYEHGYLEGLNITWSDTERGRGPTGTAIRTATPCIAKDIVNEPCFSPWRAEALKRGYASSIALPLVADDRVLGALNIYAAEPDAFDEEESRLLMELANNLAFGIVALRTRVERKKTEEELRRSEARYRAIVEDQTELICRHLPDGTLTFVNEAFCRYFGKGRDEWVGRSFLSSVVAEDRTQLHEELRHLTRENPVATAEQRMEGPGGAIRWQLWTHRMILDPHGRHFEFQSVGRDITESKAMQEALGKSAEKIKFFAYSITHDLKSPAVGIYGMTKLLYKHCRDSLDERGKEYCDKILKASEHVASLIDKINTYIVAKETPLNFEKVNISEIVNLVKDEFSPQFVVRQIAWEQPTIPTEIVADRLSMVRVFRNFIDNALKYGGDDLSEIRIEYEEREDCHIFSVSDDGAGVRDGDYEGIFGLFRRDESARAVEGAGLGLAIVKEIAERHKGRVWAEPGELRGTTFRIAIAKNLEQQL
jgi:PAS domain S-box-containing protein